MIIRYFQHVSQKDIQAILEKKFRSLLWFSIADFDDCTEAIFRISEASTFNVPEFLTIGDSVPVDVSIVTSMETASNIFFSAHREQSKKGKLVMQSKSTPICSGSSAQEIQNRAVLMIEQRQLKQRVAQRVANLPLQQIEQQRARKRVQNMSPEQIEQRRARQRVENLSPEQIEQRRARQRVENLSPEQIEQQRGRQRVENLSPEQAEQRRGSERVENLSPEQAEQRRGRQRVENLSPVQLHQRSARHRNTFKPIQLTWDFDHPCDFCGYIYLRGVRKRHNCCFRGKACGEESDFPQLAPLQPPLLELYMDNIAHLSRCSNSYNSILSFAAVGE